MKTEIRKACENDCEEIAAVCCGALGYECTAEEVKQRLTEADEDREAVFAAVCDGSTIGFIHVEKYVTLYCEPLANILGLAVSPDYQRKGAGAALLNEAERWARENGASGVRLNSGAQRTQAHDFYRAQGYSSEKKQLRFMKTFATEGR